MLVKKTGRKKKLTYGLRDIVRLLGHPYGGSSSGGGGVRFLYIAGWAAMGQPLVVEGGEGRRNERTKQAVCQSMTKNLPSHSNPPSISHVTCWFLICHAVLVLSSCSSSLLLLLPPVAGPWPPIQLCTETTHFHHHWTTHHMDGLRDG